jgi:hypothetical protein
MAGPRSLRQLRCFVASAFGKSDVDRVFSKLVKPTLKKMRVVVSRVDRINHNDDIDDKILELLNKADFCIADLTYARPSVYYEAGYAIASKPVIFVARKDHFKARDNDLEGNLRVHFDLQMKNVIPWGNSDKVFCKTLQKRVGLISKPILKSISAVNERETDEEAFAALSQMERIKILNGLCQDAAKKHGLPLFDAAKAAKKLALQALVLGESSENKNFRKYKDADLTVQFHVKSNFGLEDLRLIRSYHAFDGGLGTILNEKRPQLIATVIVSLGKILPLSLERAFIHHRKLVNQNFMECVSPGYNGTPKRSLVIPIGQVTSPARFEKSINSALDYICQPNHRKW